ncbi:hypothetical protein LTR51_001895 [Lithohypha guttulata]|nr:hypothetical protein LTR51_001895 [Lithohypha guttulata]
MAAEVANKTSRSETETEIAPEQDGTAFTEAELINAERNPNKVVTTRPSSLGYSSIVLIIVNRMIAHGTHSIGYILLFWAAGAIVAICGTLVFAEYGLTVPRLEIENDNKQSVPRNGGEKNYLEYLIKSPKRLATCLYGIPFIVLGTAAGNALVCAECLLRATGHEPSEGAIRGLAIGLASTACLVHAGWRTGGVYLFNAFGTIKVGMMVAMFSLGVAYAAGTLGGSNEIASENLSIHNSMDKPLGSAFGYAEAFLAVLFAFGGFNQATYVLGEIDHPRRKLKPTTVLTVLGVSILYILVNLAYMMVVPANDQFEPGSDTVAATFFLRIFGRNAGKVQNSFMAFSSFGNVLVQTFTASRVKQELAKEGILPFTKFLATNRSLTPRFLSRTSKSTETSDATPVGALMLHWTFTLLLILATIPGNTGESYRIFTNLYAFVVDALFGFFIGLGMLVLRLKKTSHWSRKSASNKYTSFAAALIFTMANLFPLVAVWIKPSGTSGITLPVSWWATGTIGMGLLGFAVLYWVVLQYIVPKILGRDLEVEREFQFKKSHGYWVIWHEVTSVNWRTRSV